MQKSNKNSTSRGSLLVPFLEGVAVTAAIFIIAIGTLLIANWFQLTYHNPLDTPVLETLIQRSRNTPGDEELLEQLRFLDLVVRRAYFTRRWQAVAGAYILCGALVLLLGALFLRSQLQKKLPPAGLGGNGEKQLAGLARARWLNVGALAILAVIALTLSVREGRLLGRISRAEDADKPPSPEAIALSAYTEQQKAAYTANWPSFRGPWSAAYAPGITAPTNWDGASGRGVLWKTPLPRKGFNSPIIWDDKIFLAGGDEQRFEVYCLNSEDGTLRWQQVVWDGGSSSADLPEITEDTGYAASSMACDGQRVFALFATGDLAAFSLEGDPLWQVNLGKPDINYGHASSLITYAQRLYLQYDHPSSARLIILDSSSGAVIEELPRDISSSWASPLIADAPAGPLLILSGNPYVTAYDILDGKILWQTECMNGEVAPSPAFTGNIIFAVSDFASLFALDAASGEILWEFYDDLPNVSSPAAGGDLVFVATSYGVISCLDSREGTVLWWEEFDEGFYSSPVIAGELVYLADLSGTTRIFRAADRYEAVGNPRIEEEIVCTPAFAHGRIYLRGEENLYCLGESHE